MISFHFQILTSNSLSIKFNYLYLCVNVHMTHTGVGSYIVWASLNGKSKLDHKQGISSYYIRRQTKYFIHKKGDLIK